VDNNVMIINDSVCPCGTGTKYLHCCGRFVSHSDYLPLARPETAEDLMRSRYSAYVLDDEAYLIQTWHESTRPERLGLDVNEPARWVGLVIINTKKGKEDDAEGWVEFVAYYKSNGSMMRIHENSHFIKENGQWLYLDGELKEELGRHKIKQGRNEKCPCGSGEKYKRCCG